MGKWEYILISRGEALDLSEKVQELIMQGWELWGNPQVAMCSALPGTVELLFAQAMIRPADPMGSVSAGAGFTMLIPEMPEAGHGC